MKSLTLLAALLLTLPARAALHLPAPPESGQYVVDPADVITPEDEGKIHELAQQLWAEKQTQLVVVAIDSMAQYGGARMDIEDFASALFKEWRVGTSTGTSLEESMGILLLFSRLDQKARIELGPGWFLSKDSESLRIMQEYLVPAFKRERYSSGLAFGASALDSMVRGQELPRVPLTQEMMLAIGVGAVVALWTLISLLRSGSSGTAWAVWSTLFSILWAIISFMFSFLLSGRGYHHHHHHHHHGWGSSSHSSGSSWGGGGSRSSGGSSGGSSRGGGATGSW